jgi:hypothetical protein
MSDSALPEPALSVVEWGDIRRQMRERLMHGRTARFAFFAHVAAFVVQTVTALRGARSNQAFHPVHVSFAGGSSVDFSPEHSGCGWRDRQRPPLSQSISRIGTACGRAEARPSNKKVYI